MNAFGIGKLQEHKPIHHAHFLHRWRMKGMEGGNCFSFASRLSLGSYLDFFFSILFFISLKIVDLLVLCFHTSRNGYVLFIPQVETGTFPVCI